MLPTAAAVGAVAEHIPGLQMLSEQKWNGCARRRRPTNQPVQKCSSAAMWTCSTGLSGSSTSQGHVRAAPTVKRTRASAGLGSSTLAAEQIFETMWNVIDRNG